MRDMTSIILVLDRSGSMNIISDEVVGMVNNYIEEQKGQDDYAEMTLVQFDNQYQVDFKDINVERVKPLINGVDFVPRGMTALYDSIGRSITDFKLRHKDNLPKRVLFVIVTDGYENASREFTGENVSNLMDSYKEEFGWDFIFLAAGIDAKKEGAKFGMDMVKCGSVTADSLGVSNMGQTINAHTAFYRKTGDNSRGI